MIYERWQDVPWDADRWPNFQPLELACRCPVARPHYCAGEFYYDPDFFDALQRLRTAMNAPIQLNSAHRCELRNAYVGGAPMSQHKKIAGDVRLAGHNPGALYENAVEAGFTTFGFYRSFLHVDLRPGRRWFSSQGAREQWESYLQL